MVEVTEAIIKVTSESSTYIITSTITSESSTSISFPISPSTSSEPPTSRPAGASEGLTGKYIQSPSRTSLADYSGEGGIGIIIGCCFGTVFLIGAGGFIVRKRRMRKRMKAGGASRFRSQPVA